MTHSPKLKHRNEVRVGKWYSWEELEQIFGKLDYLSSLHLAKNNNWKLGLGFDGRKKRNRFLNWAEHLPTKQNWNCWVGTPPRVYRFRIPKDLLPPSKEGIHK